MLNYGKALEIEPTRIVVEMRRKDFDRFNQFCKGVPPAELLRLVALQLAK